MRALPVMAWYKLATAAPGSGTIEIAVMTAAPAAPARITSSMFVRCDSADAEYGDPDAMCDRLNQRETAGLHPGVRRRVEDGAKHQEVGPVRLGGDRALHTVYRAADQTVLPDQLSGFGDAHRFLAQAARRPRR